MAFTNKELDETWGYWTPSSVIVLTLALMAFTAFIAYHTGYISAHSKYSAESNTPHKMVCTSQSDMQVVCNMVPKEVKL